MIKHKAGDIIKRLSPTIAWFHQLSCTKALFDYLLYYKEFRVLETNYFCCMSWLPPCFLSENLSVVWVCGPDATNRTIDNGAHVWTVWNKYVVYMSSVMCVSYVRYVSQPWLSVSHGPQIVVSRVKVLCFLDPSIHPDLLLLPLREVTT